MKITEKVLVFDCNSTRCLDTRKLIPTPKTKWILGNRIIISKRLLSDLEIKIVESQIFNQIKIKNIKIYNAELGKNKLTGTSLKKF
jgi:hypothetical protein